MPPGISVLMPIYNTDRYVAEAIESILGQTFEDFEFIIVDDGSTDRSLEIIRQYERSDRRIRVLSRPNTGIVGALNDGLALARGELIARMDADDVAYPRRFHRQVAYLSDHPECVAVGSLVGYIDGNGQPTDIGYGEVPLDHAGIDSNWHMYGIGGGISHPTALLRKKALQKIGGYHDIFAAEDADLFMRMAEVGKLANVPEVLLNYRWHGGNVTYISRKTGEFNTCAAAVAAHRRRGTRIPPRLRRRYAKTAMAVGDRRTARRQALLGIAGRPISINSWRTLGAVLFCGSSTSAAHPS